MQNLIFGGRPPAKAQAGSPRRSGDRAAAHGFRPATGKLSNQVAPKTMQVDHSKQATRSAAGPEVRRPGEVDLVPCCGEPSGARSSVKDLMSRESFFGTFNQRDMESSH